MACGTGLSETPVSAMTLQQAVLTGLRERPGEPVSLAALRDRVAAASDRTTRRGAVPDAVRALRKRGWQIEGGGSAGYRLASATRLDGPMPPPAPREMPPEPPRSERRLCTACGERLWLGAFKLHYASQTRTRQCCSCLQRRDRERYAAARGRR